MDLIITKFRGFVGRILPLQARWAKSKQAELGNGS